MAKGKTIYVCDKCGYESPKWFGKCPVCGEWNTAKEFQMKDVSLSSKSIRADSAGMFEAHPRFFDIKSAIELTNEKRIKTNIPALDQLLNGGFVHGQVLLLGGEPGVGKSTLALQICNSISSDNDEKHVYYISGEESVSQIGNRAKRLNIKNNNILITSETQIEDVLNNIDVEKTKLIIVDSIQTLSSADIDSPVGGVVQIKAVVEKVRIFGKKNGIPAILIAHVTKEGLIAGPKLVEHVVDTVVYFEGERTTDYRILRVQKNRYGPSGEIAVFQMTQEGLSSLSEDKLLTYSDTAGNVFTGVFEGSRPLNVQIQALVSRVKMASGRRISHGVDVRKVIIISAVLAKHLNLPLDFHDIYLNVSGGLNITDPGCELAIAGAILSSFLDSYIGNTFMVGEIGLDGSVRAAVNVTKRIDNAKNLRLDKIIIPENVKYTPKDSKIEVISIRNIKELFKVIAKSE
ncbi:MAG: DNA repair protein RadA [Fervidobacterium sp.]|uniref:DNA repair protein RadA n=1 Tax=Fervidobacterium sp. TaxID=1871331 RepID=UPI0030A67D7C